MTAAKLHEADDRKAKTLNTKLECRDDAEHSGEARPSGDKVSGVWDEDNNDEERRRKDAAAAALTLEIVGDLPHAEIKPPENVLFVCKLNPITRSEDLELIFSRFGTICSCEVIKDKKVRHGSRQSVCLRRYKRQVIACSMHLLSLKSVRLPSRYVP